MRAGVQVGVDVSGVVGEPAGRSRFGHYRPLLHGTQRFCRAGRPTEGLLLVGRSVPNSRTRSLASVGVRAECRAEVPVVLGDSGAQVVARSTRAASVVPLDRPDRQQVQIVGQGEATRGLGVGE